MKHRGSPHRMDPPDRINGPRDKRTNEQTNGWTDGQFVYPSVRLLDGVWHLLISSTLRVLHSCSGREDRCNAGKLLRWHALIYDAVRLFL